MAGLSLRSLQKTYGKVEVIKGVDLEIKDGEFVVFVGPSGCGKSTLLRMIAGLEDITSGELYIGDKLCNAVEPRDRSIAMVFQSYALYPHMTVYDNVGFGLKLAKTPKDVRDRKIREAARILKMEHLLDRKPGQLSGGQRQRVAIGRAIVREPEVFLFDEPLSNLDAKLRVTMRVEIKELHQRLKTTTIYVTHDQIEAMTMANKIVVMRDGRVEQVGKPLDLYDFPANLFVAGFIGSPSMNFLQGKIATRDGRQVVVTDQGVVLPVDRVNAEDGKTVTYGIRPEHITIAEDGIPVEVSVYEPTGSETLIFGRVGGVPIDALIRERIEVTPGKVLHFHIDPRRVHIFDQAMGQRL